ncbi:acyltransferase [Paraburkholderia diazotrophica]|uniref:acyltransferase family protein n=1 Tax=Paraburkholderia diazotrophica TaxID=667676 RepID=UPI00317ACA5E
MSQPVVNTGIGYGAVMRKQATIDSFEGARGLAALLVALYHFSLFDSFGLPYPGFIRHGYLFVDLFFVLSGFVICSSYERRLNDGADFWTFVIRRFGRLFPLLVFSTLIYVLLPNAYVLAKQILVAFGHQGMFRNPVAFDYAMPSAAEIFTTLTMTHGLGMFDHAILNYASWSISTEFYTYLLFAGVCIALPPRARLVAMAVLSVLAYAVTCWASIVWHDCIAKTRCLDVTYDFGFARCVASFFMGCAAFHVARYAASHANRLQGIALAATAVVFACLADAPAIALVLPLVFTLLILSLSSDRGWAASMLKMRVAQILGQRSYSIYLMHPPLICAFGYVVRGAWGPAMGAAVLLAYVVALIGVSGLTYRFIEVPARDAFNRWAARLRATQSAEYFARQD